MKHGYLVCCGGLLALSLIGGCLPDPGTPDYSSQVGLVEPIDPFPPMTPDPYQPGDERLSVGYFYETGRSETIAINTVTTNYFIFAEDLGRPVQTLTYSQTTSSDRIEGNESVEITLNGLSFWGGGILWDEPIDLSQWTTMFVGFKSSDPSFADFEIKMQWGEARDFFGNELDVIEVIVGDATAYGYTNDGEWHFLQIPLQDAIDRGWDPRLARAPFIFSAAGGEAGDIMLIDNLYFTKD